MTRKVPAEADQGAFYGPVEQVAIATHTAFLSAVLAGGGIITDPAMHGSDRIRVVRQP